MKLYNHRILRFYITCIFLCVQFSISAQKHDSLLLAQAQQEFDNKNWQTSDILCEKVFFITEDPSISNSARFLKAMTLFNQNKINKANIEIQKINYNIISSDSIKYLYRVNAALVSYLNNNFQEVNGIFNELKNEFPDSNGVFVDSFIEVLALNMQLKFIEADTILQQYLRKYNDTYVADSLCIIASNLYKNTPKFKKIKTARLLAIVPGLGHSYCGYYSEGLVSFGLNLSALALTGSCVYYKMYITGFVVGGNLLSQTTFGSFARVEKLVTKRNGFRLNSFNQTITHFLLNNN